MKHLYKLLVCANQAFYSFFRKKKSESLLGPWACLLRLSYLLMGVLASPNVIGDARPVMQYAYPDQVVLTTKTKPNGKVDNPLVKVAEALFDKANIPLKANQYPAARMFKKLQSGEADFSILVNSPLLDQCCLVSPDPVTTTELRVYFKHTADPIYSEDGLIGKEIITLRGYSYGPLKNFIQNPSNKIKLNPTSTHESAFSMLNADRASYLVNYKQPAIETLEKNPIDGVRYSILRQIDLYLVLNKQYPNAERVMSELTQHMKTMNVAQILNLPDDMTYAVNDTY